MFNPSELRSRFADLSEQRKAIVAKVDPLHSQRAKIRRDATEAEAKIAEKIKAESVSLPTIDEEMAMISRALKGKTGTPAVAPDAEG